MRKMYIYHLTEQPKVIPVTDEAIWLELGWKSNPGEIPGALDHFKIDPEDSANIQTVGEAIKHFTDQMNGYLNLEEMNPKKMRSHALKYYGLNFKKGTRRVLMISQIKMELGECQLLGVS